VGEKITLDKDSFTALASENRIKILKSLEKRGMTLSELARELDISKPAVLKHISKLLDAGLIKKREDERKWTYYSLTMKGKNILHPERVQITLLLSLSILSAAGAIAMLWKYMRYGVVKIADMTNETIYGNNNYGNNNATFFISHSSLFYKSLLLAIISAVIVSLAIYIYAKEKGKSQL